MVSKTKLFVSLLAAALALPFTKTAAAAPVAGMTQGVGTSFAITDNLGRTYTIHSTDEISLVAHAIADESELALLIDLVPFGTINATTLVIDGFAPGRNYHIYLDGGDSHSVTPADYDGTLTIPVSLDSTHSIMIKTLPSTINIGGGLNNCSAVGTEDAINKTCTLNTDISSSGHGGLTPGFRVFSGWTLDGAGHTVSLSTTQTGVQMNQVTSVKVRNLRIVGGGWGITVDGTSLNVLLENNTIENSSIGLYIPTTAASVTFNKNVVSGCAENVKIMSTGGGSILSNNRIEGGTATNRFGVQLLTKTGGKHTFFGNIIENNAGGGVWVGSEGNVFYNNAFNNTVDVNGSVAATWHDVSEAAKGGNYWARNSSCKDLGNDGFCDTAYPNAEPGPGFQGCEVYWDFLPLICTSPRVDVDLGRDPFPLTNFRRNSAPVLAGIGNRTIRLGQTLAFTLSATDADNDPLIYSVGQGWEDRFIRETGVFSWTPVEAGDHIVTFCVTDNPPRPLQPRSACETVEIAIYANQAPVIQLLSSAPQVTNSICEVNPGSNVVFSFGVTDPDSDSFGVTITGQPSGSTFTPPTPSNPNQFNFSWSTLASHTGNFPVSFVATDNPVEAGVAARTGSFGPIEIKFLTSGDTTPPEFDPVSNITVEATSSAGAVVTFNPTATDTVDGSVPVTCIPASSSTFPLGTTSVTCTATDSANNSATASFTVTVRDTTKPVFGSVPNITAEATSSAGATVSFNPTATDLFNPVTISCSPTSGSTFALGTTPVTCTATDANSNSETASFTVTVRDTTKPVFGSVPNITAEATSSAGATVSFNPTATDLFNPVTISCSHASGTAFALGTTTVSCTATDANGNLATASFTVTVEDKTAPVISALSISPPNASSASGAVVTYDTPTAFDLVDGPVSVSCSPASGSMFPPGTTPVTCGAEDKRIPPNKASKSANVTVKYKWTGFFSPVNNPGPDNNVINTAKAGSAIPVKFSLDGDMGLDIFAVGFPKVAGFILNEGTAVYDEIEVTVETAGGSSLSYDPVKKQYNYVWKTAKAWAGRNYELRVLLKDGSLKKAFFSFR